MQGCSRKHRQNDQGSVCRESGSQFIKSLIPGTSMISNASDPE